MNAKKRYLLLSLFALGILSWYYGGLHIHSSDSLEDYLDSLPDFVDLNDIQIGPGAFLQEPEKRVKKSQCTMEKCFDFERCRRDFRVFVYPIEDTPGVSYTKLLNVLTESRYYTSDPKQACLFVLSIDTLDRDRLSTEYVRSISQQLQHLPHWNNGLNHVIFNLYSGTWPNYTENNLEFDYGKAILAKASMSESQIRHGFDISIPLFHKQHPEKGGQHASMSSNVFLEKSHLLAFKGKRYVHGIGSETRNSLYHFHNAKDVVMVTTCKHGKSWKELKDERCDEDNREYEKYDYEHLLQNSTFCLVPRGRRLGSFRFLETLQAGCIPILVSNGWALPFGEVIDWKTAAIQADERLLTQVPFAARSIPTARILQLRERAQLLYSLYFSSMEKIVHSILEIIKGRLPNQHVNDFTVWNRLPGALIASPNHIDDNIPFGELYEPGDTFTAVIYCQLGLPLTPASPFYKLLLSLAQSVYVSSVLVVWPSDKPAPHKNRFSMFARNVTVHVLRTEDELPKASISRRFYPYPQIETAAILSLDEDSVLTSDEIDFAFVVWRQFPDRIVGYPARSHFYDDAKSTWSYTSRWTNDYSIVLTGAAFYHRYYNILYTEWLSPLLHKTVEQSQNCEDILMNFLVSHVTRRPPIKVTQKKQYQAQPNAARSPWNDPDHFVQRQTCLNTFAAVFGYMPLIRSNLRLDPVLFKDPVSNKRKKYRKIELVG